MNRILKPVFTLNNCLQRAFSSLYRPIVVKTNPHHEIAKTRTISAFEQNFLQPTSLSVMLVNTVKYKAKVKKRCKGCYFIYKEGVLKNYCHLKPKHKQIIFHPSAKSMYILSGVSTSIPRPW